MLLNLLITCMAVMLLGYTGYWWTPGAPPNPYRGFYGGLAGVLLILLVFWWLKILGAIQ